MSGVQAPAPGVYQRHRPEATALYKVVRDSLETVYGAITDGADGEGDPEGNLAASAIHGQAPPGRSG